MQINKATLLLLSIVVLGAMTITLLERQKSSQPNTKQSIAAAIPGTDTITTTAAVWYGHYSEQNFDNGPQKENIANESIPNMDAALGVALQRWKDATGLAIPRPIITALPCYNGEALACAYVSDNIIAIAPSLWRSTDKFDIVTVMMHEVGHLYGVPHIEGDKLMGASYSGKLTRPTPFAIVIAKEIREEKEKHAN